MMDQGDSLRIAGIVRESIVDGPGIRFTVFCQGCPHHCMGCHNPETHDFSGGYDCKIERLMEEIDKDPLLAGVTFSGGEPFCQPEAFGKMAQEVKKRNLTLAIFTGYTYEQLMEKSAGDPHVRKLLELADLLIDGPYVKEKRDLTLQFRGSSNQRVIDMEKSRQAGKPIIWEG